MRLGPVELPCRSCGSLPNRSVGTSALPGLVLFLLLLPNYCRSGTIHLTTTNLTIALPNGCHPSGLNHAIGSTAGDRGSKMSDRYHVSVLGNRPMHRHQKLAAGHYGSVMES